MVKKPRTEIWKRNRRIEYLEQKAFRYYIFCEGQKTEPLYFDGFKRYIESNPIYKDMVLVRIEPCQAETMRVIEKAEQYIKNNQIVSGQVWCVYDKDSFPSRDFNGVIDRVNLLNRKNENVKYYAAWSNECIEIWFILHFQFYISNNHRSQYIDFLNNRFAAFGLGKYEKNREDIFDILMNKGSPKKAIRFAKRIIDEASGKSPADIAPGTKVYELVEELAKYLPEEIQHHFR